MSNIIRSFWTYRVDGEQMGSYTEDYAQRAFDTLKAQCARVQLVRVDHVATSFAKTGRNWDVVTTVVLDSHPAKSVGEIAADAAFIAEQLNDPYAEYHGRSAYYNDAAMLLVDAFGVADREGRLSDVVRGFNKLADMDGYRVHKMLVSLKRGRVMDVLNGLAAL